MRGERRVTAQGNSGAVGPRDCGERQVQRERRK